tara:strand:+ start:2724 stop:3002 length:279 start_codon:yes stop_codon:yes gene_type:complete
MIANHLPRKGTRVEIEDENYNPIGLGTISGRINVTAHYKDLPYKFQVRLGLTKGKLTHKLEGDLVITMDDGSKFYGHQIWWKKTWKKKPHIE